MGVAIVFWMEDPAMRIFCEMLKHGDTTRTVRILPPAPSNEELQELLESGHEWSEFTAPSGCVAVCSENVPETLLADAARTIRYDPRLDRDRELARELAEAFGLIPVQ